MPGATFETFATNVMVAVEFAGTDKPVHWGEVSPTTGDVAAAAPAIEVVLAYVKPAARSSFTVTAVAAALGLWFRSVIT